MLNESRVEWSEVRATGSNPPELFLVIAEYESEAWRFFERSPWQIRWFEVPSTPKLIERAESEQAKS